MKRNKNQVVDKNVLVEVKKVPISNPQEYASNDHFEKSNIKTSPVEKYLKSSS